jgi:hypothetical protein
MTERVNGQFVLYMGIVMVAAVGGKLLLWARSKKQQGERIKMRVSCSFGFTDWIIPFTSHSTLLSSV